VTSATSASAIVVPKRRNRRQRLESAVRFLESRVVEDHDVNGHMTGTNTSSAGQSSRSGKGEDEKIKREKAKGGA